LEDTAQTHAFDGEAAFAYKTHDHTLSSQAIVSSETVTFTTDTDGFHTHGVSYNPAYNSNHSHDGTTDAHDHDMSGSTDSNTSGRNVQYMSAGTNIGSSSADIDSGTTGSTAADLDSGNTGSSGGTISGNSGSHTVSPTMAEDTYPNAVTLTINGVDRTAALGGPWSDAFDQTGSNKIDITSYVNADGEHTLAFASSRNGRIVGHINVYY